MSSAKTIQNYNKTNDNELTFELHNNDKHKISFINALRRTCIGGIIINAVDIDSIVIYSNTSCINESMLKKRLELSPIYKKDIYHNIKLSLNITNEEYGMKSIYLSDFKLINKFSDKEDTQYEIDDIFVYPNILFAKLKHNETIHMDGEITSNNATDGSSAFCPVCPATFHFKRDETKVAGALKDIKGEFKQNDFKLRDADRLYTTNDKNEPTISVMSIESCGNMSSHQVLDEGLDALKDRLSGFIKNIDNGEMVNIIKADYNIESFDYVIRDEDTTLGNLLQDYLFEKDGVKFVGYDIPHPLDPILIIRMGLEKNNTIENNNKMMIDTTKMLIGYIDDVQKEWKTFE